MSRLLDRLLRHSSTSEKGPHLARFFKKRGGRRSRLKGPRTDLRVDVGCGGHPREGYVGCDIRRAPGVEIVCSAWEINRHCKELRAIFSRHTLEHLTWEEARLALKSMYEALAMAGEIEIIVPNMDFHIEQWRRADWSDEALADQWSDGSWAMAGFYGWQRDCAPDQPGYERSYWDVHKSGYNAKLLAFFLKRAGFSEVETQIVDRCHLVAKAKKLINTGERQVSGALSEIRPDHVGRYELADRLLAKEGQILDAACGVGYGSSILAEGAPGRRVLGVDIHEPSVAFANENYRGENTTFQTQDITDDAFDQRCFDAVVSFETIEHVDDAESLLARFSRQLKPGGTLIISTPNETLFPFDPQVFRYHVRHYTKQQFTDMLQRAGFRVDEWYCQNDRESNACDPGAEGLFMIAVCRLVAEA